MKLDLITKETIKTQLGITDTIYDSLISSMIPIVSSDIRRILSYNFDIYMGAMITNGSDEIYISSVRPVEMGQVLHSPALSDDTYVKEYDMTSGKYKISSVAIADGTYVYPTINISMWPSISKMLCYKCEKMTTGAAKEEMLRMVTFGNVRKDFAESEINKFYDYPSIFIKDLGRPFVTMG